MARWSGQRSDKRASSVMHIIRNVLKKNNKFLNLFSGVLTGMFLCVNTYLIYNISKLSVSKDEKKRLERSLRR